tara:strand:+ start:92 stop:622 length:531 start_codon:yes stop_codon:yes gene_type:complete
MSDIKIDSFSSESKTRKFRSNFIVIVLILLLIALFFTIKKVGEKFLIFFIFIIILLLPVFLLFKSQLLELLPSYLRDNLTSEDELKQRQNVNIKIRLPNIVKEIAMFLSSLVFIIGGGVMMYFINKKLKDPINFLSEKGIELSQTTNNNLKDIALKILGALLSVTIGAVILVEAAN